MGTQGPLRARTSVGRVVKDRREGMHCLSSVDESIFLLASEAKNNNFCLQQNASEARNKTAEGFGGAVRPPNFGFLSFE